MDSGAADGRIASAIGVGLRALHSPHVLASRPAVGWFEVHAENYMDEGPARDELLRVRRDYPIALHGVGLSLGSAEGIERGHLTRFVELVGALEPVLVSEHLAWSVSEGVYLNDLLPLPYAEETLDVVARNVEIVQNALGRQILVENPSRYLRFRHSTLTETEFLAALVQRTGCGLLCDVNNIYVSCSNLGGDPVDYIGSLPVNAVGEIHLAGHSRVTRGGQSLLIDDHAAPVCPAVWDLYRVALGRFGLVPSLVEWDKDLPPFEVLLDEARLAGQAAASVGRIRAGAR